MRAFLERLAYPWLGSENLGLFFQLLNESHHNALSLEPGSLILIAESRPERFWGSFLGCVVAKRPLAIFAQKAPEFEWQFALKELQPALTLGRSTPSSLKPASYPHYEGKILIPTGGTGGRLRFAIHSWESLQAAVEGLAQVLPAPLDAIAPLPLYHVSGLMPGLRTFFKGGEVDYPTSKAFEDGLCWNKIPNRLISCVPTQLERLLRNPEARQALKQARCLFLGGGKTNPSILQAAHKAKLPIALSYGMTESAAMLTLSLPESTQVNPLNLGKSLPHAKLWVQSKHEAPLTPFGKGHLWVQSPSLFQGYFPNLPQIQSLYLSNDMGCINEQGELLSVWRTDRCIISGGEKIDPALIEETLHATGLVAECHALGKEDPEWGEKLAIYLVFKHPQLTQVENIKELISKKLNPKHMPKEWHVLSALPRKENGKLHTQALLLLD